MADELTETQMYGVGSSNEERKARIQTDLKPSNHEFVKAIDGSLNVL